MAAGKRLMEKKDPTRAILEFRNAIQATPRNPEAYFQLAQAYIAMDDVKSGILALRQSLEVDPKYVAARLRLGQLMSLVDDQGVVRDAQQRLQELVTESPNNANALHALAFTDLKLGETENAMDLLGRAIAAAPQDVVIAVTLAQVKLQQKDIKGAEEVLQQANERAPNSADAAVVLGRFYTVQGRAADAKHQFGRALAIDRNNESALISLARLQDQTGDKADAEQNFKRLSVLPGQSFKSSYAIFLFQEGRHDEAIREFERLFKADPENRAARTRLIAAYRAANRPADADKVVSEALKRNPEDLDALLQRGEISMAAGKNESAERDFNKVLSLRPDSAPVHYALAQLYLARGIRERYRQELSDALQIDPSDLRIRLQLAQALLVDDKNGAGVAINLLDSAPGSQKTSQPVIVERNWALWSLRNFKEMRKGVDLGLAHEQSPDLLLQDAILKVQSGDIPGARSALEKALKIDSTDLNALALLTRTFIAEKQGGVALKIVEEYAARQPKSAQMQEFLGTVRLANGDRAGARGAFLAAKAADPKDTKADLSLTQLDVVEGKWDEAEKSLKTKVANGPPNALLLLWLGDIEAKKGDLPATLEYYRKAAEADPQNARALNNLAFVLVEYAKRPDEALKYAEKAVELAPNNPDFADTLGWTLYNKGLYTSALKTLERVGSRSENVAWKYHLAMAYAKAGDPEKAQRTLKMALKVNPQAPEAEAARNLVGPVK